MSVRQLSPILVGLALVLTVGCAPSPQVASPPETPTRQVEPTVPGATSTPGGRSSGAVITFNRSGGIAGISDHWTIYLDGRVIGPADEEARIPADELTELLAEIEAAGFFDWPPLPRSLESCADCFTYSIVVAFEGRTNQITLVDGQTDAPEGAWSIIERIQAVLGSLTD